MTISGKSMNLYELNKKLKVARPNGFTFNQENKLTIKLYSPLRYININYYLNFPMPLSQRQCFRKISHNLENKYNCAMIKEIMLFFLHVGSGI